MKVGINGMGRIGRLAPVPHFAAAPRPVDVETLRAVMQNRMHVLRDYSRRVVLPVLRIGGGRIGIAGLIRRGSDPVPALLRQLLRHADRSRRYRFAIAHAGCPEPAARLRDALAAAWPQADAIYLTELGAAASVHAGPGALGIAALEYQPPDALRPPA